MMFFKKTRSVYAPLRQLAVAVALSTTIFVLTRQHPTVTKGVAAVNPVLKYREADISDITEAANPINDKPICLPYIFYDKPVKTGSTAITKALERYLGTISEHATPCKNMTDCTRVSEEICSGIRPRGHLIQHVLTNATTTACLRGMGFYHVTSIREPRARITSAWRYSTTTKRNHYSIPYNATFEEFLERFPRCALFHYYDDLATRCNREEALERAEEIASRFDEVIDLYDDTVGDVHKRIERFLRDSNVSPGGRATTDELDIPDEVVELEYLLYNKLREKRKTLAETPKRVLCER